MSNFKYFFHKSLIKKNMKHLFKVVPPDLDTLGMYLSVSISNMMIPCLMVLHFCLKVGMSKIALMWPWPLTFLTFFTKKIKKVKKDIYDIIYSFYDTIFQKFKIFTFYVPYFSFPALTYMSNFVCINYHFSFT